MTTFFQFYDITGETASRVPLVRGQLVAYYNTGTGIVPETPAQIAAARAAGMGVALIDQWPGDTHFTLGLSDILDVENGAATTQDAISGVLARQAHGWQSTVYISQSALSALDSALRNAGCDMSLVWYGVANYSLSLAEAEALLAANPRWAYVQYGDPVYNPATLIPGTNVTLSQVNADIDVANTNWSIQFMPAPPPLPPYPVPTGEAVTQLGSVKLSWTSVGSGVAYMYQVADVSGNTVIPATDVSTPSVTVTLPVGSYQYRVIAHVSPTSNWSAWSEWFPFTVT